MANAIKYSTTGDTQSLKKGNFYFGIGDVGKGPTSNTSYYNGVSPTTGGYTVYSYSSGQTSKISYYSASNDAQLITFTNGLSGQNFTTASQCLNWYASQTDYVCVNRDYENIVTSGLTFNLDAGFTPSYPTTGTTWYDVSYSGNNGTLINSPIYNSTDGGSILFDGVDDYVSLGETLNLNTSSAFTISCVFKVASYNNTYPTIFTLKTSIGNSLVLLLNSSGVYSPLTFGWNGSNTYKPTTSISTGVWNVLTLVYNGSGVSSSSNFNLYINNALLSLSASSSLTGIGQVNSLGTLNSGVTSYWFNGNIPCIQIYNRSLSPSEVLQNYTAISSRFSSMDPDAQAFISAANITGSTQQGAINTLVVSLKGYGIWTKMKALYPFVGGTATQHKFNLKNPLDTDAAFRLVFNGGWTHSSTGALPNGTNAWADTKFIPSNNSLLNSAHVGYYSRTNSSTVGQIMMGTTEIYVLARYGTGGIYHANNSQESSQGGVSDWSDSSGLFLSNRIVGTEMSIFRNTTKQLDNTSSAAIANVRSTYPIPIGCQSISISGQRFFNSYSTAFSSIGDGLTDTDAANYYTAVQTFQSTLGRQVGVPIVSDSDAQAFLNVAVITNTTEANAVNTLVISLKSYGIWTKMKALYPFVGGTATQHKFNLKNPLDTDAAFRLVFNGGITHSSTGVKGNGTNSYYQTFLTPSTVFSSASGGSQFIYNRNNTDIGNDIGSFQSGVNYRMHMTVKSNNTFYGASLSNAYYTQAITDSRGFFGITREPNAPNFYSIFNTNSYSTTDDYQEPNSAVIGLAFNIDNGNITAYCDREHAMACIADGLTVAESQNLRLANLTFQTTLGRNVGAPIVSDSDAQAFLDAAVITGITEANAVNTLVISLKSYGIWTKMKAVYPFVGGTATQHKFNLKNPLDTNAAFRLVFNGGWTHSSTGALPNGVNGYADSYLVPSTTLQLNSSHMSGYIRTNTTSGGIFGCYNAGVTNGLYTNPKFSSGVQESRNNSGDGGNVVNTDSRGFWINTRIVSTQYKIFKNNTTNQTSNTNTTGLCTISAYVGSINVNGTPEYQNREIAFASIGDGLTDTESANYYTAVQTFQTSLSRNV